MVKGRRRRRLPSCLFQRRHYVGCRRKNWGHLPLESQDGGISHQCQVSNQWQVSNGSLFGLAFSPSGKLLAGRDHAAIRIWDTETGKEINGSRLHTDAPRSLYFSPDGKTLISTALDQRVLEWDVATGHPRDRIFAGPFGPPQGEHVVIAVSPDGATLAQVKRTADGKSPSTICLWDTVSGKELRTFGQVSGVRSLEFSLDSRLLVSASNWKSYYIDEKGMTQSIDAPEGTTGIHIWDPATGKLVRRIQPDKTCVEGATFSPDGKSLASVDSEDVDNPGAKIRLWDITSGKELQRWDDDWGAVYGTRVFSPDGKAVACISQGGTRVVARDSGKVLYRLRPFSANSGLGYMAYSPSGRILAGAESFSRPGSFRTVLQGNETDATCIIHLWDAGSGQEIRRISVPPESHVTAMAFAPDGRTLATGGGDSAILLWDVTGPAKDTKAKAASLSADDLKGLWSDLAADPVKADQAIWTLAQRQTERSVSDGAPAACAGHGGRTCQAHCRPRQQPIRRPSKVRQDPGRTGRFGKARAMQGAGDTAELGDAPADRGHPRSRRQGSDPHRASRGSPGAHRYGGSATDAPGDDELGSPCRRGCGGGAQEVGRSGAVTPFLNQLSYNSAESLCFPGNSHFPSFVTTAIMPSSEATIGWATCD